MSTIISLTFVRGHLGCWEWHYSIDHRPTSFCRCATCNHWSNASTPAAFVRISVALHRIAPAEHTPSINEAWCLWWCLCARHFAPVPSYNPVQLQFRRKLSASLPPVRCCNISTISTWLLATRTSAGAPSPRLGRWVVNYRVLISVLPSWSADRMAESPDLLLIVYG